MPQLTMRHRPLFSCASTALAFAITWNAAQAAPEVPAEKQRQPIALVGATLHPVAGEPIPDAVIVFAEGRIVALGGSAEIPEGAERIDVAGKRVYPAMFDAMTDLGLVEINSIRATTDRSEVGTINPNVRAQVAVNPDSEHIPVTRSNGVLLALTAPNGGLVSGKSAVLQLDGWTFEDMTLRPDVGMHVRWPRMTAPDPGEQSGEEQPAPTNESLQRLEDTFAFARAYQKARTANGSQPIDLRWEAMLPVLDGKMPLIVEANELLQIQAAVAFAERQKVRMILFGGYDAERCAALLKRHDIPVILAGVYRLPERRSDPYDAPFTLAERLRKAGVKFCISASGRFGGSEARNLPYHAAMAGAFGLPHDEALRAITLAPAEILGVADRVGSLEPGKDATLIVTDGDPLETRTQVEMAFVEGRKIDLSDRHKRLWKKYEEKYRRLYETAE